MDKETNPLSNDHVPQQNRPYNKIVRFGLWATVISAAVWAGGLLIKQIEMYLPYALGIGIAIMALGLILEFRSKGKSDQPQG